DAEASVVSPFTSKPKTIKSVVDICREGRCSLATSFASVKFLILYGVIASTLRLFQWYHAVIMSEWCFILADGVTLVGLSYAITLSKPLPNLNEQRPTSSLIGPTTLTSIVGQELINVIFLFSGVHMLISEVWYCPFSPDNVDLAKWWLFSDNHMATTLFFTIITQQQLAAWVFSFGSRYRAPIWRNYLLVAVFALLVALDIYLILGEPSVVMDLFRISSTTNVVVLPDIPMPFSFRAKYFGLLVGNVATVIFFEYVIVLGPVRDFLRKNAGKHRLVPLSHVLNEFQLDISETKLTEVCMGMNFNAQAQLDYKEFVNVLLDILIYALPNIRESTKQKSLIRLDQYLQSGFPSDRDGTRRLLGALCAKYDFEGDLCMSLSDLVRVFHVELFER
ncbi:hypothetical protein BBP00_00008441, partial [Phytophthora kernoviae]